MKKALLIIFGVFFVLVIGACVFILMFKRSSERMNEFPEEQIMGMGQIIEPDILDNEKGFFAITTLEELESFSEKLGYEISRDEYGERSFFVYNVECCNLPVQFTYLSYDQTGVFNELVCQYSPFFEEYAAQESSQVTYTGVKLKQEVEKFLRMLEQVFEVNIGDKFYIVTSSGELISNQEDSSYEQIIDGEASVYFTLRDRNGFFWCLSSETTEEGLLYLAFTNYYNQYADNIVDITVE